MEQERKDEKVLGFVQNTARFKIRVSIADFKRQPYVYLDRLPVEEPKPGAEAHRPSGLTLRPEAVEELTRLLSQALEVSQSRMMTSALDRKTGQSAQKRDAEPIPEGRGMKGKIRQRLW